ncbi:hypothetical protein HOY82DRAFT_612902 [Tuber indicum]|nr:hypothetical protein HOY82DRAFT_612902 [Tuber indicum]
MARMLAEYEVKLDKEVKESGTAQADGKYEQTMAQWKVRVESSGDGRGSTGDLSDKANVKRRQPVKTIGCLGQS